MCSSRVQWSMTAGASPWTSRMTLSATAKRSRALTSLNTPMRGSIIPGNRSAGAHASPPRGSERSTRMRMTGVVCAAMLAAVTLVAAGPARLDAQPAAPALGVGATDLGGVVASASGPEAGVWVIAETTDLPTKYAKIVVTDDRGRYLLPDLPKANYTVWVRGYGLVDSPKVKAAPGKAMNLTAT